MVGGGFGPKGCALGLRIRAKSGVLFRESMSQRVFISRRTFEKEHGQGACLVCWSSRARRAKPVWWRLHLGKIRCGRGGLRSGRAGRSHDRHAVLAGVSDGRGGAGHRQELGSRLKRGRSCHEPFESSCSVGARLPGDDPSGGGSRGRCSSGEHHSRLVEQRFEVVQVCSAPWGQRRH